MELDAEIAGLAALLPSDEQSSFQENELSVYVVVSTSVYVS